MEGLISHDSYAAPVAAAYLPDEAPTTSSMKSPKTIAKPGQENLSQDHTQVKADNSLEAVQTPHQVMENQEAKILTVQPVNLLVGHQHSQVLTVSHTSNFSNHDNIAKHVKKILQQKVTTYPNWTRPSIEYTDKPIKCQICKTTIIGVESLLVCDACEKGTHLKCLQSYSNKGISIAEWHCPRCLMLSNGKPLRPKYGSVPRNVDLPKVYSNAGRIQCSSGERTEIAITPIKSSTPLSERGSHSLAMPHEDAAYHRLDTSLNGPSYLTQVRAPITIAYLPVKASATSVQSHDSVPKSGQENMSQDHIRVKSDSALEAVQTSHQVMENQEEKISAVQPVNLQIGHKPSQRLTFVHISDFSNHDNITKRVQKILQQKVTDHPNSWTPLLNEYTDKPINCQICKTTITDVENLLVCDDCENGTHLKCLQSYSKTDIPKSEWHCPRCLMLSNGKTLPPKHGQDTRNVGPPKVSSNVGGIQSSSDKRAENKDSQFNPQKQTANGHSSLPYRTTAPSLGTSDNESLSDSKTANILLAGGIKIEDDVHTHTLTYDSEEITITAIKSSTTLLQRGSHSLAMPHVDETYHRLVVELNGPTYSTQVQAPVAAAYLLDEAQTTSVQSPETVANPGQAKMSLDHTQVKFESPLQAVQTSHQVVRNQEAKILAVQPLNLLIGHQPSQCLTFVHKSYFSNHDDIAKSVQKILQQKVIDYPKWTPPSSEYTNKPMNCQICKTTIMDIENLLVCDVCEKGTHLKCLQSYRNKGIPEAEWYCPGCLMLSNGDPFPPQYGSVTRVGPPKISSDISGFQS